MSVMALNDTHPARLLSLDGSAQPSGVCDCVRECRQPYSDLMETVLQRMPGEALVVRALFDP
jgi:hypothetical protein